MRKAEPLAGLGGVVVLVAAILSFDVLHAFLIPFALLATAVPLATLFTRGPVKSIGAAVLASAFGWIAIILALIATDWLAVAGSILAWVGSWLSMADESTPGATPPDVPRLKAPAA